MEFFVLRFKDDMFQNVIDNSSDKGLVGGGLCKESTTAPSCSPLVAHIKAPGV